MAGDWNFLGDIPLRSFGFKTKWHFEQDDDFLTFFNAAFPLPLQNSWTGFRLTDEVSSKVISELLMRELPMNKWRQLLMLRRKNGANGRPTAELFASIRTWTARSSQPLSASAWDLADTSGKAGE